jgi:hypothetical protein
MEEEVEEMGLEKYTKYNVIIVIDLVILRESAMLNCVIWKIKVSVLLLKKQEMRNFLYQV